MQDIANTWFNQAVSIWSDDPHQVAVAAAKLEQARALSTDPRIAIHLAAMYIKMNRNGDATSVYREAMHDDPADVELSYHAGAHVLRHGRTDDIRAFFENLAKIRPADPLANMVLGVHRQFPSYVHQVTSEIGAAAAGRRRFILCCALWGESFIRDFLRYTVAALLSPDNVPVLSERYDVHFVVFTTPKDEVALRADPIFKRLVQLAKPHFVHIDPFMIECARSPHYMIAAHTKFSLMSCSHYVALEAGRRLDAEVMNIGADNILNDGFLANAAKILEGDVSVVAVPGFRLYRDKVLAEIDGRYRRKDGVIEVPMREFARLLCDHIPDSCFVDSERFTRFPLFLCWRVADEGVLVFANHYMPYIVRARFLKGPLSPSIDPVDGRFLFREMPDLSKMHLVRDAEIAVFDAGDNPLVEEPPADRNILDTREVGLWLWCYWDALRERYFRAGLRIAKRAPSAAAWEEAEIEARGVVEQIMAHTQTLEAGNRQRRTWNFAP